MDSVFPQQVLGSLRDSVVHTWVIILAVAVFCIITFRRYSAFEPAPWQMLVEQLVEYVENLVTSTSGRSLPQATCFLTTMLIFVAAANILGMFPGLNAPTRDLNVTLALSLVSLIAMWVFAIRKRGLKSYLKSLVTPVFMLPFNILSMISRVLSMTLRLFGNIFAGEMVVAVVFYIMPPIAPLLFTVLSLVTSILQAMVFTILTFVFIVDALGDEPETTNS